MSDRHAVRACDMLKSHRTEELRGCIYFRNDAAASALARKLRGFSDRDLAWLEFLSRPNMDLVCGHFETTPHVLMLAQSYETARRKAYPIAGDDARVERAVDAISATARPARSPQSEIGARYGVPVKPARPPVPPTPGAPADLFDNAAPLRSTSHVRALRRYDRHDYATQGTIP